MNILYTHIKERNGIWSATAQEYYEIQQLRKFYERKEKELAEKLKGLSENESAKDNIFVFIKDFRNGSVNYKAIPELADVDLDQYRGAPVTMWQLKKI